MPSLQQMHSWFSCCENNNYTQVQPTLANFGCYLSCFCRIHNEFFWKNQNILLFIFILHFQSSVGGEDIFHVVLNDTFKYSAFSLPELESIILQMELLQFESTQRTSVRDSPGCQQPLSFVEFRKKKIQYLVTAITIYQIKIQWFHGGVKGREDEITLTCNVLCAVDGSGANITFQWWECFHHQGQLLLVAINTIYFKCGYFWAYSHSRQLLLRTYWVSPPQQSLDCLIWRTGTDFEKLCEWSKLAI